MSAYRKLLERAMAMSEFLEHVGTVPIANEDDLEREFRRFGSPPAGYLCAVRTLSTERSRSRRVAAKRTW
jgi:hypothetical protein